MSTNLTDKNVRPPFDTAIQQIVDYVYDDSVNSELAYQTARYCLMDSIGCGLLALNYPECTKLLGPVVSGTIVPNGVRVLGTEYQLDPILAAFNIGTLIRWLDFNDTWLAAEWGHPSDNLGAILSVSDYLNRKKEKNKQPVLIRDLLTAMIKAHEIQGVLALENSFNRVGLDHVILVKVASTAVASYLLGATKAQALNAVSNAWVDGQSLRTYRHAPNTGSRKSWAAGDATRRGVELAMFALKGEPGYPSALTAPRWGFYDVLFDGKPLKIAREYASYVMENVLFKISYPAEFHAQTAVECAVQLHPKIKSRLNDIEEIHLITHESAIRIISKTGPLHNPADRDHCLQYMVAIGLLYGDLNADHYEQEVASDPVIDQLRDKMRVEENLQFSKDYLDPNKRSIANSIQIKFKDGSMTDKVTIEYPIGHRRRREAGIPLLIKKFEKNAATQLSSQQVNKIKLLFADVHQLDALPVDAFLDHLSR